MDKTRVMGIYLQNLCDFLPLEHRNRRILRDFIVMARKQTKTKHLEENSSSAAVVCVCVLTHKILIDINR